MCEREEGKKTPAKAKITDTEHAHANTIPPQPSFVKSKSGGSGLPFGREVFGSRSSSKNGCANTSMAVGRFLGGYANVLQTAQHNTKQCAGEAVMGQKVSMSSCWCGSDGGGSDGGGWSAHFLRRSISTARSAEGRPRNSC